MTAIAYLGSNRTDLTVTFAIASARYEYFLANPSQIDSTEFLTRIALGKALAYAKRRAIRTEKLQCPRQK